MSDVAARKMINDRPAGLLVRTISLRAPVLVAVLVAGLLLCLGRLAQAETYFLRDDGTAAQSQAAQANGGGCESAGSAMSVAAHNAALLQPGDVLFICGAIRSEIGLTPPSSGSAASVITYRGDHPGHPGSLEQNLVGTNLNRMLHIRNKQHIKLVNLTFRSNAGIGSDSNKAAVWVSEYYEPTGHIEIDGCTFTETVSGLILQGDVRHVGVFRSTFRNMVNNGVGVFNYAGRTDTTHPSHLTIGGSRDGSNTFVNIGREDNPTPGSVPGQAVGTQVDDLVFSYNHVYADEAGWGTGIYLNGVDRVLVEFNHLHDLDATHRRAPITFKTDKDWINTDVVIRFNKVGPIHGGGTYTTPTYGIRVSHCLRNVIVYGNYIVDVEAVGIEINWGWSLPGAADGCIVEDVFVYSNVVDTATQNSGVSFTGTAAGDDLIRNAYITNNSLFRTVSDYTAEAATRYAIQALQADHKYDGLTIKNNIIDSTRDNAASHIGIRARVQADLAVDYNHHFFPGAVPMVYFDGSACAPCDWNSLDRPPGYGAHDTEGPPLFGDPEAGDFSLQAGSPCRDTGESLQVSIPSLSIQGVHYDFSISDGLDPLRTDWSAVIPVVATLNHDDHGPGWEKGAYVFAEAAVCSEGKISTPCVCGGAARSSGHCCGEVWQETPCGIGDGALTTPRDAGAALDTDADAPDEVVPGGEGGCRCRSGAAGPDAVALFPALLLVLLLRWRKGRTARSAARDSLVRS